MLSSRRLEDWRMSGFSHDIFIGFGVMAAINMRRIAAMRRADLLKLAVGIVVLMAISLYLAL